ALVGDDGQIGVIDTEQESSALYAERPGVGSFGLLRLDDYSVDGYIEALREAFRAKVDACIVDSLSHEWQGPGGILSEVDRHTDKFGSGWKTMTPEHERFVTTLLKTPYHFIGTIRSKTVYEHTKVNGRTV